METKEIYDQVRKGELYPRNLEVFSKTHKFYNLVKTNGEPVFEISKIISNGGVELIHIKGWISTPCNTGRSYDLIIPMSLKEAEDFVDLIRKIYIDDTSRSMFVDKRTPNIPFNIPGTVGDQVNALVKVINIYKHLVKHVVKQDLQGNNTADYITLKDLFRTTFFRVVSVLCASENYRTISREDSLEYKIVKLIIDSFKNEELC